MKIVVRKDGDGFLAQVQDKLIDTYAWGSTKEQAIRELILVVEAIVDIHLKEIEQANEAKKLLMNQYSYAV